MKSNWQRTLWFIFFAQFVSAMGFSVSYPFLPVYVHQLGTHTGISLEFWSALVFSGQAFAMMLISPFWGSVADRYGYKLMLERATFGGAVILLLMGFVGSAEELALLRTIQGLITGTIAAANALVAAMTPRDRIGYAMGVLQIGQWSGVAAGPFIGGFMADAFGFQAVFVLTAVLLVISGMVIWLGVSEHASVKPRTPTEKSSALDGWRAIVTAPGVAVVYAARFLGGLGQTMLLPVLPLFIAVLLPQSDLVNSTTGLIVGLASAATTASAIYLGRLGDRVGHRRVLIASSLAAGLAYLPQALVTSAWQLLALQMLAGVAIGGIIPTLSALLARYTPPGTEGAVYGLDNSISSAARAAAPLLGAAVATLLGLRIIFALIGGVLLAAALLAAAGLPRAEHADLEAIADEHSAPQNIIEHEA